MKVGDLVKYFNSAFTSDHSLNRWIGLGLVVEVHGDNEYYRVKWFDHPLATWYSKKNLEVVNEYR
jgi:hypothetical protein